MFKREENEIYYPMNNRNKIHFDILKENPNQTYLNLPFMFKTDNLDIDKLSYAINMITKRHEALRSSFNEIDGVYYQIVKQNVNIEIEIYDFLDIDSICKPFDVFNGPCFRVGIYKNIVILDFHHFIMDGYSMGIFFIELSRFYGGHNISTKKLPTIDELHVPAKTLIDNKEYWKRKLQILKERKNDKNYTGDNITVGPCEVLYYPINLDTFKKIKSYSLQNKLTPNVVALASYLLLCKQRTNKDIISIATNMSTRNMHNLNSIGLFTNQVAMPFRYNKAFKTKNFLDYVKNENEDFLKHQQYNYDEMLREIGLTRDDVTDSAFVYQREMISEIKIDNKICSPIPIPIKEVAFDIVFSFFASRETPLIQIEYQSNIHSREEIEKLLDDYLKIIELIISDTFEFTEEIIREINKPHELFYGRLAKTANNFCSIKELFQNYF